MNCQILLPILNILILAALPFLLKKYVEGKLKLYFDTQLELMRQAFDLKIHNTDRKDKYRLAAIDERLKAHQCAYTLARKMASELTQTAVRTQIENECLSFWDEQSLYLSNDVRKLFWDSLFFYRFYDRENARIAQHEHVSPVSYKKECDEVDAKREQLHALSSIIEKAVDLEAIEEKDLQDNGQQKTN